MLTLFNLEQIMHTCKQQLVSLGFTELNSKYYNLEINSRFRNKLGQCCYNRKSMFYTIKISKSFIQVCPEYVSNTMMHELIHSINGCMNHGPNFKHVAKLVNDKFGYNVSTTAYYDSYNMYLKNTKNYKYKVKCSHCGKEWLYEKAGKIVKGIQHNPHYAKCPICQTNSFSIINL